MRPYRHPDPAVRREMRRIKRSRPRYGRDSRRWENVRHKARRQERAQQDGRSAKARLHGRLATVIVLLATAAILIGWDYEARHRTINLPRPVDVTSTTSPHPATPHSHP